MNEDLSSPEIAEALAFFKIEYEDNQKENEEDTTTLTSSGQTKRPEAIDNVDDAKNFFFALAQSTKKG